MKKIVVVEDDPTSMKIFADILSNDGFEVHCAINGEKAIDMIDFVKPDMVLMDIQLPKISGISVFNEMQKQSDLQNIPVVAITAFALDGDRERILDIGFKTFIGKPITLPGFRKIIRSVVDNSAQEPEPD